jgi:prolyl-tRNA synthetase
VPPQIAPFQIVILPMLRDTPEDAALIEYCQEVVDMFASARLSAFGEPIRILLDKKPGKAAAKRWDWVRKGAPIIVEVGPRDMAEGKLAVLRRNALWNEETGKPAFQFLSREGFSSQAPSLLEKIQQELFAEAEARREANIDRSITTLAGLAEYFGEDRRYPGWAEIQWSRPTGAALDGVVEQLKALKLTLRNVPLGVAPADGMCLFTGEAAVERIYVARSY